MSQQTYDEVVTARNVATAAAVGLAVATVFESPANWVQGLFGRQVTEEAADDVTPAV